MKSAVVILCALECLGFTDGLGDEKNRWVKIEASDATKRDEPVYGVVVEGTRYNDSITVAFPVTTNILSDCYSDGCDFQQHGAGGYTLKILPGTGGARVAWTGGSGPRRQDENPGGWDLDGSMWVLRAPECNVPSQQYSTFMNWLGERDNEDVCPTVLHQIDPGAYCSDRQYYDTNTNGVWRNVAAAVPCVSCDGAVSQNLATTNLYELKINEEYFTGCRQLPDKYGSVEFTSHKFDSVCKAGYEPPKFSASPPVWKDDVDCVRCDGSSRARSGMKSVSEVDSLGYPRLNYHVHELDTGTGKVAARHWNDLEQKVAVGFTSGCAVGVCDPRSCREGEYAALDTDGVCECNPCSRGNGGGGFHTNSCSWAATHTDLSNELKKNSAKITKQEQATAQLLAKIAEVLETLRSTSDSVDAMSDSVDSEFALLNKSVHDRNGMSIFDFFRSGRGLRGPAAPNIDRNHHR